MNPAVDEIPGPDFLCRLARGKNGAGEWNVRGHLESEEGLL